MPAPMRDSLTRCDSNPYSMYDVRKRPDEMKPEVALATQPIHKKDTIEIRKDRIQKEALNRLHQPTKYKIFAPGFMRIGKYVFLGVTLPPYVLLYGIPKWVLVVAIPFIYSFCVTGVEKSWKTLCKKVEKMIHKVQNMALQLQNLVRRLIQPVIKMALDIRNALQRISQQVVHWFQQGVQMIKKPFVNRKEKKKSSSVIKQFQKIKGAAQHWATSKLKSATEFCETAISWIKKNAEIVRSKRKQVLQKLNRFNTYFANQSIWSQWGKSQEFAKEIFNSTTAFFAPYKQRLIQMKERLKVTYKQSVAPILARFFGRCKEKGNSIYERFEGKRKHLSHYLKQIRGRLKALSQKQFKVDVSNETLAWMPAYLRKAILKVLRLPFVQKMIQLVRRGAIASVYYPLQAVEWCLTGIHYAAVFIGKGIRFFNQYAMIGVRFCLDYLSIVLAGFGSIVRKILFHFLVVIIMICILMLWGFQLTGEVTTRLLFKSAVAIKEGS